MNPALSDSASPLGMSVPGGQESCGYSCIIYIYNPALIGLSLFSFVSANIPRKKVVRELLGGERKEQSLRDITRGYYTLTMLSDGFELAWDKLCEEVIPNRIVSVGLIMVHPISVFLGKTTP